MEARDCSKAVGGRGPAELAGSVREIGGVGGRGAEGSWKERKKIAGGDSICHLQYEIHFACERQTHKD